ncbi:MAG: trehalose-phosphatase, partial [Acinetobacter sp.]
IALHYREYPELESQAIYILENIVEKYPEFKISHGKCVAELISQQANKGLGIRYLQQQLNLEGITPIFIGDDVTDEDGFKHVNVLDGFSIKVGGGETEANYRLKDIEQVTHFLCQMARQLE